MNADKINIDDLLEDCNGEAWTLLTTHNGKRLYCMVELIDDKDRSKDIGVWYTVTWIEDREIITHWYDYLYEAVDFINKD